MPPAHTRAEPAWPTAPDAVMPDAGTPAPARRGRRRVLPGFGLTMGVTLGYLGLIVLIPLAALFLRASGLGWQGFLAAALDERALAAYRLSFGASAIAASVNAVFGLLVAWVLVRYDFFGKRIVDGFVDLPFALPTAVAGIALASLYAENGWVGQALEVFGVRVAYTYLGVVVALVFIGLPFVVRTVQPVLEDLDAELEEAAASLGASRMQTFARVLFPTITPALITGTALAFARAIGEYGSVIFIAQNRPYVSEIAPLLIITQLEQFNYAAATAIGAAMLMASFVLLLIINLLQRWTRVRASGGGG